MMTAVPGQNWSLKLEGPDRFYPVLLSEHSKAWNVVSILQQHAFLLCLLKYLHFEFISFSRGSEDRRCPSLHGFVNPTEAM